MELFDQSPVDDWDIKVSEVVSAAYTYQKNIVDNNITKSARRFVGICFIYTIFCYTK